MGEQDIPSNDNASAFVTLAGIAHAPQSARVEYAAAAAPARAPINKDVQNFTADARQINRIARKLMDEMAGGTVSRRQEKQFLEVVKSIMTHLAIPLDEMTLYGHGSYYQWKDKNQKGQIYLDTGHMIDILEDLTDELDQFIKLVNGQHRDDFSAKIFKHTDKNIFECTTGIADPALSQYFNNQSRKETRDKQFGKNKANPDIRLPHATGKKTVLTRKETEAEFIEMMNKLTDLIAAITQRNLLNSIGDPKDIASNQALENDLDTMLPDIAALLKITPDDIMNAYDISTTLKFAGTFAEESDFLDDNILSAIVHELYDELWSSYNAFKGNYRQPIATTLSDYFETNPYPAVSSGPN